MTTSSTTPSIELFEGAQQERSIVFERYLRGDLDRVERPRFERLLNSSVDLEAAFAEAYDAVVDAIGLSAILPSSAETAECFSEATLTAWTEGRLAQTEAGIVRHHLRCPRCAAYVGCLEGHRIQGPNAAAPSVVSGGIQSVVPSYRRRQRRSAASADLRPARRNLGLRRERDRSPVSRRNLNRLAPCADELTVNPSELTLLL